MTIHSLVQESFTRQNTANMSYEPKVIVFGASGNVGQYIVPALLRANVATTVSTRPGSKATFPDGVKVIKTDLGDSKSLVDAIRGHDVVIALVPAREASAQKLLPDAAVAAGAKYFLPSEYGHDATNEEITPYLPIFAEKRAVTAYLREKEKQGLSWTGITTALFFDWGLPRGMFDMNFKDHTATIWDSGDARFSAANMGDIADGVVKLVTDLEARKEYLNQSVYVSSVQVTQNELLAAAEEVTGKKFKVEHRESGAALEDPTKVLDVLKAVQFSDRGFCDYARRVEERHGKFLVNRQRDVKEVLREVLGS